MFRGRLGALIPLRRTIHNFGDLIGPLIVDRVAAELGLTRRPDSARLVTVGSIMYMTEPGDVVWGTGINGKTVDAEGRFRLGGAPDLDVRAVRGPLTRKILQEAGTDVPEVFGDPGMLWSRYWPRESYLSGTRHEVGVVPNFNDRGRLRHSNIIDPRGDPQAIIGRMANCDFITGSSLHGIIIAESLGIPARLVTSQAEHRLKYDDYYRSTGRPDYQPAKTVREAISLGGEPAPIWDAKPLLEAFPRDLFE